MKKAILFGLPVMLLAIGGAVFAGMKGIINIPGLSPAKAQAMYKESGADLPKPGSKSGKADKTSKQTKADKQPKKAEAPKDKKPSESPEQGNKRLAELWNSMDTDKLKEIVADWQDPQLAAVLAYMDTEKVAALLSALDSKRSSSLSRQIQKDASVVATTQK